MNLSIDFETLTMDEAEALEDITGLSLSAIGQAFKDPDLPKMKALKAIAVIAYRRDHGGTLKAAIATVGKVPLTELSEGVEVTSTDHPPVESE